MRFGFGFRSTNSSSGGSSSGGGGGHHISRGRSKRVDDRPFPPQLEEHPYFNYFPMAQQNYYTRYMPRPPPAYQLPPPPPAPSAMAQQRRRHGSFSENQHKFPASQSAGHFHFRSRSSSGRFRHMKTPNDYFGMQPAGTKLHKSPQLLIATSNKNDLKSNNLVIYEAK